MAAGRPISKTREENPRLRPVGKPFRWNMACSHLLRRLGRGRSTTVPAHQQDRLLRCTAHVLRAGGVSDFVFVGRSLESVYDLLCGALAPTTWYDRVQLLQLSLRNHSPEEFQQRYPNRMASLRSYFRAVQLTPRLVLLFRTTQFSNRLTRARRCSWNTLIKPCCWSRLQQRLVNCRTRPHDRSRPHLLR